MVAVSTLNEATARNLPVLIICYARTKRVINLLNQLDQIGISSIYIAIDGPKDSFIAELQTQLFDFLETLPLHRRNSIKLWRRENNLGVAVSVITAIDWFFDHVESGAIVEDDLEIDNSFFPYLKMSLETFRHNSEIMLISGNSLPQSNFNTDSLQLVNYPQTWGWGTWKDRWTQIRESAYGSSRLHVKNSLSPIHNFWTYGTKRVLRGQIDTWDIPLALFMFETSTFSILPPVNLVSNVGVDAFATHTLSSDAFSSQPINQLTQMPSNDISKLRSNVRRNNKVLERKVFKIKWFHAFLPIYSSLDSIRSRLLSLDPLQTRLERVRIPS